MLVAKSGSDRFEYHHIKYKSINKLYYIEKDSKRNYDKQQAKGRVEPLNASDSTVQQASGTFSFSRIQATS